MSGGITQLVAIGAQDVWLTGNPEVSFFRNNYKRHTNFSHVVQRQVLQGTVNPSSMTSIKLERRGDMLSYIYLTKRYGADQKTFVAWNQTNANGAGPEIDHIDFLIGGQIIDTQDDTFMNLVANPYLLDNNNKATSPSGDGINYFNYYYPLKFWFCQNWQSALPLISLQYHDIEIRIYWSTTVLTSNPTGVPIFEAWANFITLDTMERQMLAQNTQNHLIYQVQKALPSGTNTQNLVFNHPIKFITTGFTGKCLVVPNYNGQQFNISATMLFQVNGVDVGEQKALTPHFDLVPNYYHCSIIAGSRNFNEAIGYGSFLLPFCLDTTKLQPTGTLNFSRIDSARLVSSSTFQQILYAVNYNILKIENGMGGLMYAN
jgi:hypothetical protein